MQFALLRAGVLLRLLFDPDDEGVFLQKVGLLSLDYTTLYLRKQ
jgi:hypothetical protein